MSPPQLFLTITYDCENDINFEMEMRTKKKLKKLVSIAVIFCGFFCYVVKAEMNMANTLSDNEQLNMIAFGGLAFVTGLGVCFMFLIPNKYSN